MRDDVNPWTRAKLRECYYEVRHDDDQRMSIVQQMQRSTDFLRRIIVPVQGQRVCVSLPSVSDWRFLPVGFDEAREAVSLAGGVQRAANWRNPNRVLVIQDSADPSEAKVFRADAPQGACENLVCALRLWANPQIGGDSFVDVLVEGFKEQIRSKTMDELTRCIKVDTHEAVIGDLVPTFNNEDFSEEAAREGVDDVTLGRGEEGTLRTFIAVDLCAGTTDGGRGLSRGLPSHAQGRRGSGRGEAVLQVRGNE